MHKIIAIGKVEDLEKWEAGFRTHVDLFKRQTIVSPIGFSTPEGGDEVAVLFQVDDLDTYFNVLDTPETAVAMASDGFDRASIKVFVLDKEVTF